MKDDLQLGKLKENCLLLKLYHKLRKMFLSPRREHLNHIYIYIYILGNFPKSYLLSSSSNGVLALRITHPLLVRLSLNICVSISFNVSLISATSP